MNLRQLPSVNPWLCALPMIVGQLVLSGCGGGLATVTETPVQALTGRVMYEARIATPTGASSAVEARPARRVRVFAMTPEGEVAGETVTDAEGNFTIESQGASLIRVVTEASHLGMVITTTTDAQGQVPHAIDAIIPATGGPLEILAPEAHQSGIAGAFHITDSSLSGAEAVHAWTGEVLPPVYTYWGRGVTTSWSYYRGERPADSNRFCLELLGGEPGRQFSTDTDEHDESIILHEFGHFVMDRLSTDSSPGGMHPSGHLLEPGLAWEEGRASWFASAVLQNPWYFDTVGVEPQGSLRVSHNLERGDGGPRGVGSEQGVAEILWDLSDGAEGLPDQDADGVALGPAVVLRQMMALRDQPGAYPSLATLLGQLVEGGVVSRENLSEMLRRGGHPPSLIPDDANAWPPIMALGDTVVGKVDGISNPAPNGGPPRPENGFDAVHIYRFYVPETGFIAAQLRVLGSGRAQDRQDVDIELRDIRANLIVASRLEEPVENISRMLTEGWYVLYVRDGGSGNRVGYQVTLTAQQP